MHESESCPDRAGRPPPYGTERMRRWNRSKRSGREQGELGRSGVLRDCAARRSGRGIPACACEQLRMPCTVGWVVEPASSTATAACSGGRGRSSCAQPASTATRATINETAVCVVMPMADPVRDGTTTTGPRVARYKLVNSKRTAILRRCDRSMLSGGLGAGRRAWPDTIRKSEGCSDIWRKVPAGVFTD